VSGWKADDIILHGVLLTPGAVNYGVAVRGENNHTLSQYLRVPGPFTCTCGGIAYPMIVGDG
jgi:hypothetical protein